MAKPTIIELTPRDRIPILYEDRSILAIDKPAGWMLVPISWQKTPRNLQAALLSSIGAGAFWARSRNLKYIRYIHRLDAETSGVLLFAKNQGALQTYEDMFEARKIEKVYLAVTNNEPKETSWSCRLPLGPDPDQIGRMRVDETGKAAETQFRLIASSQGRHLIEARPYTGRTHQIRIHLARAGCPIVGDEMYGHADNAVMGLRAAGVSFNDPFTQRPIEIRASLEEFLSYYRFDPTKYQVVFENEPKKRFLPRIKTGLEAARLKPEL